MENISYVVCSICKEHLRKIKTSHIKSHGLTLEEFNTKFPSQNKVCQEVRDKKKICDQKYREEHREELKKYFKKRHRDNPEIKNNYQAEYKIKNLEAIRAKDRVYAKKNKSKKQEYDKKYRKENKEIMAKKRKKWSKSERGKEVKRKWQQKDYKKQPHIYAWRRVLYSSLKRLGKEKEGHTIDLLRYSSTKFKQRIEVNFLPGMSWDNYGEWHIDHKKAITNFDTDTPAHVVNALCNLQPLWATSRKICGKFYLGNLNKNKY